MSGGSAATQPEPDAVAAGGDRGTASGTTGDRSADGEAGGSVAAPAGLRPGDLESPALNGQDALVFSALMKGGAPALAATGSRYVLLSAMRGTAAAFRRAWVADQMERAVAVEAFGHAVVDRAIGVARADQRFPRELCETLVLWCRCLVEVEQPRAVVELAAIAYELGSRKYPPLHLRLTVLDALALAMRGDAPRASEILADLGDRPYLIMDRGVLPDLLSVLATASLLAGDVRRYKATLFRGVCHFYTDMDARLALTDRITRTYRHRHRALLDRSVRPAYRLLYGVHLLASPAWRVRLLRVVGFGRLGRLALLSTVYAAYYALGVDGRVVYRASSMGTAAEGPRVTPWTGKSAP